MGLEGYSPLQLDEYEKSVFLTQAQEEFVISMYDGKNNTNNMFELTEEDRRFLSSLIRTVQMTEHTNCPIPKATEKSKFYKMVGKDSLMFIIYERCTLSSDDPCVNGKVVEVVPTTYDELHRVYDNPFRGANHRRVLRLDLNEDIIELVSDYDISDYTIRMITRPKPIILVDLYESGLSIHGLSSIMNCQLNPVTHEIILNRAVQLALISKSLNQKQTNTTK